LFVRQNGFAMTRNRLSLAERRMVPEMKDRTGGIVRGDGLQEANTLNFVTFVLGSLCFVCFMRKTNQVLVVFIIFDKALHITVVHATKPWSVAWIKSG
jgi:hypothetical protein